MSVFKKILIANRGEIAVRIIRACKELGIKTIAVHSTIDSNSLHVKIADESVCIGEGEVNKSYLNSYNILSTALLYGADAIHPGIGFFAESSSFAKMCEQSNITYIGPSHTIIDSMSNKITARDIANECNVPVAPGINTPVENIDECIKFAEKVGYPIIIKASAGGGGKGIRIVRDPRNLEKEFINCKKEALNAFGNSDVFIEKCLEDVKHVEIQVLGDSFGNVIHLGERDCSIQRGNQKILEEAPCNCITEELREKMTCDAIKLVEYTGYVGAGTIEFLVDKNLNYYFMEMNTRIQVEHPITEMVTGVDIVKEQIKVAAGERLSISQSDVKINGYSIECRVNSENPLLNFMPSIGNITALHIPTGFGIRIESALCCGYSCTPFYDSLIMKIIAHGKDRNEAINKMRIALSETEIAGIKTNIPLLNLILSDEKFLQCKTDTSYISKLDLEQLLKQ